MGLKKIIGTGLLVAAVACTNKTALKAGLNVTTGYGSVPTAPSPTNQTVVGTFESFNTSHVATGFCFDPDQPATSLQVAGYIDGTPTSGTLAFQSTTTIVRNDVNSANGITGAHGFSVTVTVPSTGFHNLYVYCRDSNTNALTPLSGSPKSFGTLGGVISQIRVKNPSSQARVSPVVAVVSVPKNSVANQAALNALGITVGGVPAAAIKMESYWQNGNAQSVALFKVVSNPIAFNGNEERLLDVRADGLATPAFELPPDAAALATGIQNEVYAEVQLLDGTRYRAVPGGPTAQVRVLESSAAHLVAEVRAPFILTSGTTELRGLYATFYVTMLSQSNTLQLTVRIANDSIEGWVIGGFSYRNLKIAYHSANNIQFDVKQDAYGVSPVDQGDGWKTLCLDGACRGQQFIIGTPNQAPPQTSLVAMDRGRIGDGQSFIVQGAISKIPAASMTSILGTTHLAEAISPLYGLQTYTYSLASFGGASPLEFYFPRRFNETRAAQIRNSESGLCNEAIPHGHPGSLIDPYLVPLNPGGTGFQPHFSVNGLPSEGWRISWTEGVCRLVSDVRAIYREWLRPQFFVENSAGMKLPLSASLSNPRNQDNWWAGRMFDGNGALVVNPHNANLSVRSGPNWDAGSRVLRWECDGATCGYREDAPGLTGWDDQHKDPGFIIMAWKFTGDPILRQLSEEMLTSIYLEFFNDWANGLGGGPWFRDDAERAIGRTTTAALWLMKMNEDSPLVPLLKSKIGPKLQVINSHMSQNLTYYGISSAVPEPATAGSIGFCDEGLHASATCGWYASMGRPGQELFPGVFCQVGVNCLTYYIPHWQVGFEGNMAVNLLRMGIATAQATQWINLYMESAPLLHTAAGRPYSHVLLDDHADHFPGDGLHMWWVAPTAMAASLNQSHPNWPLMQSAIHYYQTQLAPWVEPANTEFDEAADGFMLPLNLNP